MRLFASAYARLCRPDAIRAQVLAHLFLARVHNLIKASYEQYLASSSSSSSEFEEQRHYKQQPPISWQTSESEPHQNRKPARQKQQNGPLLTRLTRRKRRISAAELDDDHKLEKMSHEFGVPGTRTTKAGRHDWDWRGFPALSRRLAAYDWFSNGWMILASLRTIFQRQLSAIVEPLSRWLLNGRPGNCLLMGRVVKPLSISDHFTVLMSSYHLGWRFMQAHARRSRLITMVVFLLASERDLERVYASIELRTQTSFDHNSYAPLYDNDELLMGTKLAPRTRYLRARPSWVDEPTRTATACSPNERLFRQVMCYQVHRNHRVYFRLRPNRTREAHKLLRQHVAAVSLVTIIFFALQLCFTVIAILMSIMSDYRYARVYPGCDPHLDDQLARGELTYFSSVTLSSHHLMSACVDSIENLILWLDSGMSLTFVPAFCYMLNYDLLLYWSQLSRKLESLAQRSKHVYVTQVRRASSFEQSELGAPSPDDTPPPPPPCRLESMRALESDIHELQFEMFDFFHQIRRTDLIVGDTLTHAIIIWLSHCAFVNYNLLMHGEDSLYVSVFVELILILGLFVLSLATFHLLELRRRCLRSYRTLCSLMAYDRTRKKRSFIKLMDFFLGMRNSITYHLVRTYAYEPTTFITIIAWSFSCFFIAFTLFRPHKSMVQESHDL